MAYYSMYDMMYGPGSLGFIWMILFWAAIIWLIFWAVKQFSSGRESSAEILEKRLAKGEISKKEYLELKKMLRR